MSSSDEDITLHNLILEDMLSISEFGDHKYYSGLIETIRSKELAKQRACSKNTQREEEHAKSEDKRKKKMETMTPTTEEILKKDNSKIYRNDAIENYYKDLHREESRSKVKAIAEEPTLDKQPPDVVKSETPNVEKSPKKKKNRQNAALNSLKKLQTAVGDLQSNCKENMVTSSTKSYNKVFDNKIFDCKSDDNCIKVTGDRQSTYKENIVTSSTRSEDKIFVGKSDDNCVQVLQQKPSEKLDVTDKFGFLYSNEEKVSQDDRDDVTDYSSAVSSTSNYTTCSSVNSDSPERPVLMKTKKKTHKTSQRRRFKPSPDFLKPLPKHPKSYKWIPVPEGENFQFKKSDFPPL